MASLTIALENSEGGCGWVKIANSNLTRAHIEDLVDVASDYGTRVNDFLCHETPFPVFSEFLQCFEDKRLGNGDVQADLNLEHFSDNDVQHIFCDFFKKQDGPVRVFIFVGKGHGVDVSSEGSVERIEHYIREHQTVRRARMTR